MPPKIQIVYMEEVVDMTPIRRMTAITEPISRHNTLADLLQRKKTLLSSLTEFSKQECLDQPSIQKDNKLFLSPQVTRKLARQITSQFHEFGLGVVKNSYELDSIKSEFTEREEIAFPKPPDKKSVLQNYISEFNNRRKTLTHTMHFSIIKAEQLLMQNVYKLSSLKTKRKRRKQYQKLKKILPELIYKGITPQIAEHKIII